MSDSKASPMAFSEREGEREREVEAEPALMEHSHGIAEAMTAFAVLRAQNSRLVGRLASSLGIEPIAVRTLFHIASVEVATPERIAALLGLDALPATQIIERIEAAGLVRRVTLPSDGMVVEVAPAGQDAVNRGGAIYSEAFTASIAPKDIDVVTRALQDLGAHLGAAADRIG